MVSSEEEIKRQSREITSIDKELPEVSSITNTTNSITFSGRDNNKIVGYQLSSSSEPSSSEWISIDPTFTLENMTVSGLTHGQEYYVWLIDEANNTNTAYSVTLETVPNADSTTVTVTPSTTALTNQDVSLKISTTNKNFTIEYSLDDSQWLAYSSAVKFASCGTLYYRLSDGTNIGTKGSYRVGNIDKLAPYTPTIAPYMSSGDIALGLSYSDQPANSLNTSSNAYVYVSVNGSAYTSTGWFNNPTPSTTYTITAYARDMAGNQSASRTVKFTTPAAPPHTNSSGSKTKWFISGAHSASPLRWIYVPRCMYCTEKHPSATWVSAPLDANSTATIEITGGTAYSWGNCINRF